MTSDRPRVTHLTSAHLATDVRIFLKQARSLANDGYRVSVVGLHAGDETVDGVRLLGLSIPRNRSQRMLLATWQVLWLALRSRADVFHFHDAELIPVGLVLRLLGRTVIYDVHEDLPRMILHKAWIPLRLRRFMAHLFEYIEAVAARSVSAVIAATPHIGLRFPPNKVTVIQNFPLSNELLSHGSTVSYEERNPVIAYVGATGTERGMMEMVRGMEYLDVAKGARLRVAGRISDELRWRVESEPGSSRVDLLGPRSRDEVATLLSQSRMGLVVFHPLPNHVNAQPNKLFEYMSAGLPVVASDFPLWRSIVEGAGCGLLVDPLDPSAIGAAVEWLLSHPQEAEKMGRRGYEAVLSVYNWDREAGKLLEMYARLTA